MNDNTARPKNWDLEADMHASMAYLIAGYSLRCMFRPSRPENQAASRSGHRVG